MACVYLGRIKKGEGQGKENVTLNLGEHKKQYFSQVRSPAAVAYPVASPVKKYPCIGGTFKIGHRLRWPTRWPHL